MSFKTTDDNAPRRKQPVVRNSQDISFDLHNRLSRGLIYALESRPTDTSEHASRQKRRYHQPNFFHFSGAFTYMVSWRARIHIGWFCLALASCSTMSPKECQIADWREIGWTDGLAGRPLSYFDERRSDCAEAKIRADTTTYLQGREQGLKSYCQLGNAAQIGLRGEHYAGVCPPAIDQEFRRRYRIGLDIHRFTAEIDRLYWRFDMLERRFDKNRNEFDRRLGTQNKNDDLQRIYRNYEHEQSKIREEQRSILNSLHWNQDQLHNAEALLERLR